MFAEFCSDSGFEEARNSILALLQTYDSSLYSSAETLRLKIYKDVFNLER